MKQLPTVDLDFASDEMTYVVIRTPAGVVRVNTNLVDNATELRPVVIVEIEQKLDWDAEVHDRMTRVDVRLVHT